MYAVPGTTQFYATSNYIRGGPVRRVPEHDPGADRTASFGRASSRSRAMAIPALTRRAVDRPGTGHAGRRPLERPLECRDRQLSSSKLLSRHHVVPSCPWSFRTATGFVSDSLVPGGVHHPLPGQHEACSIGYV